MGQVQELLPEGPRRHHFDQKKPRLRLPCAAVALQQEFVVVLLLSVSFNVFLAKHGGGGRETNDNSSHDREKTGDEYSYVE